MSKPRWLLIAGGLSLLVLSMAYGLWYAVFLEHQRLDQIGMSLAGGFAQAADRNLAAAHSSLEDYGRIRSRYTREVDAHSHWTGLALLLILLGVAFDNVGFSQRGRAWLALVLMVAATAFPACVLWQNLDSGNVPRIASAIFAGALTAALACAALGIMRQPPEAS